MGVYEQQIQATAKPYNPETRTVEQNGGEVQQRRVRPLTGIGLLKSSDIAAVECPHLLRRPRVR
jgi:hypothetical protein